MKKKVCIWIGGIILFLFCCTLSFGKTIRAGYDAIGTEEQFQNFLKHGINTHFLAVRFAPYMKLKLDENQTIVIDEVPAEFKEKYINIANTAAKYGIDIYFKTGYFDEYIKQLGELTTYNKAYVQGPIRYLSVGETTAPAPLERKYWLGQLLCEAKFAAELSKICPNIKGFSIDAEMYSGGIMWRSNCSFDDQTFSAVMEEIKKQKPDVNSQEAAKDKRYEWLEKNGLLEKYFEVEQKLTEAIAREFRSEVDKINPDFELGILPYEENWFYDGWIRGLSNERTKVLVCSEGEYGTGVVPSSLAKAERFKTMGVNVRYIPGYLICCFSPKQLAIQAEIGQELFDGYWLFTTYSFWQKQPDKLHGPYLLKADRMQYWQELEKANKNQRKEITLWNTYERNFASADCPGFKLLTGNKFYPAPKADLPIKVTYEPMPDVALYKDANGTKLFDGAEYESFGTIAWHAKKGLETNIIVDLSKTVEIERLYLSAYGMLAIYPPASVGKLSVFTATDPNIFYPLVERSFLKGHLKESPVIDYDNLGVEARYIKIKLFSEHVSNLNNVLAVSELAIWGKE